ncbi:MAG: hypothetical protein IJG85_00905 [Eubacteriaceae bacterium]|nr:hypothetical protein [Eubacteriaceae bacterium]MBR0384073.1 hypothetical protein [Eubacteriaceae bacterium]
MILYAVKIGQNYVKVSKSSEIQMVSLAKASVFSEKSEAEALKKTLANAKIIKLTLTEEEL